MTRTSANANHDFGGTLTIVVAMALATVLVAVHDMATRRWLRDTVKSVGGLREVTVPGLIYLGELRRLTPEPERGEEARAQFETHLAAYTALEPLAAEAPLRQELDRVVARLLRREPGAVQESVRAIDALVALHADATTTSLHVVTDGYKSADALSTVLLGTSILLLALVAFLVIRVAILARAPGRAQAREHDAFLTRLTHELRATLTPVAVNLAVSRGRSENGRAIDDAERGVNEAIAFAAAIDELARASGSPPERSVVAVEPVVRYVADSLRGTGERLDVHVDVEKALDVAVSASVVTAIITHLLRNAIGRVGTAASGKVAIRARSDPDRPEIVVRVEDSGPDIPGEGRERLFRAFEGGSKRESGFGVGLATALRLARANGGSIEVESPSASGSAFVVRLPRGSQR